MSHPKAIDSRNLFRVGDQIHDILEAFDWEFGNQMLRRRIPENRVRSWLRDQARGYAVTELEQCPVFLEALNQ